MATKYATVRVYSIAPPLQVVGLLGEAAPSVDAGTGGWELTERPRRAPVTTWKSPPPRKVALDLMLDGWASRTTVAAQVDAIEAMALPQDTHTQPPVVFLDAPGVRVPSAPAGWVITSLELAESLRAVDGNLYRQLVKLELTEYVADVLADPKRAPKRKPKPKPKPAPKKTTRAKSKATASTSGYDGETLPQIAQRTLGASGRWPELAALNGIRDPRAVRAGQLIRLP